MLHSIKKNQIVITSPARRTSSGFTLIELMISVTIGIIVLTIAVGLVFTSAESRRIVKHSAEMQSEAFFVTHTLKQQLAQTGYRGIIEGNPSVRSVPIEIRESAFPPVPAEWQSGQIIKTENNQLFYRFDGASHNDGTADGSVYDCLGNIIPQGNLQESMISIIDKQLVCTVGADSIVLIGTDQGIEAEQLTFSLGVDDDGDNGIDRIIDSATATTADFLRTRHLTINLLLATRDGVTKNYQTYRYMGVDTTAADNRLRSEVLVSVAIRN